MNVQHFKVQLRDAVLRFDIRYICINFPNFATTSCLRNFLYTANSFLQSRLPIIRMCIPSFYIQVREIQNSIYERLIHFNAHFLQENGKVFEIQDAVCFRYSLASNWAIIVHLILQSSFTRSKPSWNVGRIS